MVAAAQNSQRKKVILFGAGQAGEAALSKYRDKHDIVAILDNDVNKHNKSLQGIPIVPPATLPERSFDMILIASEYFEQIHQQLIGELKITPDKVKILDAQDIKPLCFGSNETVKANAEKVLFSVSEHLIRCNRVHYADAGTLLGIIRDGELIPWDDDIDFAVLATELEVLIDRLPELINSLNNSTKQTWCYALHYSSFDFFSVHKGDVRSVKLYCEQPSAEMPAVDLFVKYVDGELMHDVLASRGLTMPSCFIANTRVIQFKGKDVCVPDDAESYLAKHYGDDWRVPQRNWNLGMLKNATLFPDSDHD